MISLLISIKHRIPFVWNMAEWLNGRIFRILYPDMRKIAEETISSYPSGRFAYSLVCEEDLHDLSSFLLSQPKDYVRYFNPHGFDEHTLSRLYWNPSFLMMKVVDTDNSRIAGYFLLRCFFTGRSFSGRLVDRSFSGFGVGKSISGLNMLICHRAGMRMFATISSHNQASLKSCRHANEVKVVKTLPDDYLLVEFKLKKNNA